MRHIKSFREYIEALKAIGEVQEINHEVDWNLEIGAIIRRSYDLKAPAPLFNKIKGIESGFRVFGAPAGVSKQYDQYYAGIALSLGLDPKSNAHEIISAYISHLKKNQFHRMLLQQDLAKKIFCWETKLIYLNFLCR